MDAGFYHYNGSFTTPPCTENVEYLVMDSPVQVRWHLSIPTVPVSLLRFLQMTADQLKHLRDKVGYPGSARPVQVRGTLSSLISLNLRCGAMRTLTSTCECCRRNITEKSLTTPSQMVPFLFGERMWREPEQTTSKWTSYLYPHIEGTSTFHPLLIHFLSPCADSYRSVPLSEHGQSTYKPQPPTWALTMHCNDKESHRWVNIWS